MLFECIFSELCCKFHLIHYSDIQIDCRNSKAPNREIDKKKKEKGRVEK